MKRSIAAIITTLTLDLFFAPRAAVAQRPGKVLRIEVGFLSLQPGMGCRRSIPSGYVWMPAD